MSRKAAVFLSTMFMLVATQVYAVGLGNVTLDSALNQPLNARIEILDLGNVPVENITVTLASPDDFNRFDIDRIGFLLNIEFDIETTASGVFVNLTTLQPVRDPYLSFILDTRWSSGRILSEHTVLLDLPVFDDGGVVEAISQPISQAVEAPQGVVQRPTPATPVPAPVTTPQAPAQAASQPPASIEPEVNVEQPEPTPTPSPVVNEPQPIQASATPTPAGPDTLEVLESDTLWEVALRVRPDSSVSVQQTMLAIQRLNPNAFVDGNINLLRAGEVLQVPDLSDIESVDQQQAVSEVVRQNQQVSVGAQPLTAPASGPSSLNNSQQGQLSVVTSEDPADTANASGEIDIENAALDARIQALQNQLAVNAEEADRARLQQEQFVNRLDDLDAQIASAMEIINLQDLQLAQLQQSLATATAAAQLEPEINAEDPAIAAAAAAEQPAPANLIDRILNTLSNNSVILLTVVLLVVLLLVIFLLRRSKSNNAEFEDELDELAEVDELANEQEAELDGVTTEHQDRFAELASIKEEPEELPRLETVETEAVEFGEEDQDIEEFDEVLEEANEVDVEDEDLSEIEEFTEDEIAENEESGYDAETDTQVDDEAKLETEAQTEDGSEQDSEEPSDLELPVGAVMDLDSIIEMNEQPDDDLDAEELGELEEQASGIQDTLLDSAETQAEETQILAIDAINEENDKIDFDFDELLEEPGTDAEETEAIDDGAVDFDLAEFEDEIEEPGVESADEITDEVEEFDADDVDSSVGGMFDLAESDSEVTDPEGLEEPELAEDVDAESVEFSMDSSADIGAEPEPEEEVNDNSDAVTEVESIDFDATDSGDADSVEELDTEDTSGLEVVDMELSLDDDPDNEITELTTATDEDIEEAPEKNSAAQIENDDTEIETPSTEELESGFIDQDDIEAEAKDDIDSAEMFEDEDNTLSEALGGAEAEELDGLEAEENLTDAEALDESQELSDETAEEADEAAELEALEMKQAENDTSDLDDLEFLAADAEAVTEGTEDEFDFLSDDDEAATKLDLAYAYQKMGDVDGAREILEEVMTEGNESQVTEAKTLLGSLED